MRTDPVPFVHSVLIAGVLLALVAPITVASANAGTPWRGGEPAGEPIGLKNVAISYEELVIDMRPLVTENGKVLVRAIYHLDNPGDPAPLDLVFASGSATSEFGVTLAGKPVASVPRPDVQLPETWRPPSSTPRFDGTRLAYELRGGATPIGFALVVPRGRHDLAISYRADPVRYHLGEPTIFYQLGYVLSPARTWAGFAGIDILVHVPPGWRAATTPELKRDGDTLRGKFPGVPANALAITVQAPPGAYAMVRTVAGIVFALVALGGVFVVVMHTRSRERRRRAAGQSASGLAAVARGLAWGLAFLLAGGFSLYAPTLALPAGQADHHGLGHAFAMIVIIVGTVLVIGLGSIVSLVAARKVHR